MYRTIYKSKSESYNPFWLFDYILLLTDFAYIWKTDPAEVLPFVLWGSHL